MNLYEIPARYNEMLELLEDDGEGVAEAAEHAIEFIKENLNEHVSNLGLKLSNIAGGNVAIDLEIERLKALKESRARQYNSIKSCILGAMIATKENKITTGLYTFSVRAGSKSVEILDESKLPDEYVKVKVVSTPIKADIKKGIDAGLIDASIARVKIGDKSLTIK